MNWREFQSLQRVAELFPSFLSYVDEGEGEPVVLLHGIPTWGYVWSGIFRALTLRHRVLIPDLLGYGFSDRRDGFDRSVGLQAQALDAWMEQLGISHAAVVGHDVGGGVAQQLAVRFPHRVGRLCLMNTVCYDSWPIELMIQLGHPRTDHTLSAAALKRLLGSGLRRLGFSQRPPDEVMEGLLAPYRTEVGKLSLIRDAAALDTNHTLELMPQLAHLDIPTLVLWGEDDLFQKLKYGERLAWDLPAAQFVRVQDARHFLMFDQPHEVTEHLLGFLGAHTAPREHAPDAAPHA
jgi:pimeloyl-ACP methyl ester carboxylesterase